MSKQNPEAEVTDVTPEMSVKADTDLKPPEQPKKGKKVKTETPKEDAKEFSVEEKLSQLDKHLKGLHESRSEHLERQFVESTIAHISRGIRLEATQIERTNLIFKKYIR